MKYVPTIGITLALMIAAAGCTSDEQEEIARIPSAAETRAFQVEAQQMLRQVFKMQEMYYAANKQYGSDLGDIGVTIPPGARYHYALAATTGSWTCSATANLDQDATVDRWVVDQTGNVTCATNDAAS